MPANLQSYKVVKGEQPSSTKFDALVQAAQDNVNAVGNTANSGFTLGKWLDTTKLKQGGAASTNILAWNGTDWAPATAPPVSAFVLISDQILNAPVSSIVFSSIAGTYKHLLLFGYLRSDTAANNDPLLVRFNGDTGANYDSYDFRAIDSTPSLAADEQLANTSMRFDGAIVAASAPANLFSSVEIMVPHYANTANNKTLSGQVGCKQSQSAGGLRAEQVEGWWRSNSAVSSITLLLNSGGNFISGGRIILAGLN